MLIGRRELCSLIPHGEGMCLLDEVTYWDQWHILCRSQSHHNPRNPLIQEGELPAVHALEYGAQAMAVHGTLVARSQLRKEHPGWLASVSNAEFTVSRLDTITAHLQVEARLRLAGEGGFVYDISVTAKDEPIASARLTVAAFT